MARFSEGSLDAKDFRRLHHFEAYAQLFVDGEVSDYASLKTMPLSPATVDATRIRSASRARYGRPVAEVDAEIRKLIESAAAAAPVGRRRRTEP